MAQNIEIYRSAWGLVGADRPFGTLEQFIEDAAVRGYRGVEFPLFELKNNAMSAGQLTEHLDRHKLIYIPLIATLPENWSDLAAHMESFRSQLALARELGATRAAVHTAADSATPKEAVAYFSEAKARADDVGLDACFETHRSRPMNDPWRTAHLLEALPDLRLTSDLSHWMVIVDRIPNDIMDLFDEASRRAGHLHARVGHEKGPQVPDPRDPIWAQHVELHRRWWTISVEAAAERGEVLTVSPEFGPPPYMDARPFTQEPAADVAEVNDWMRARLAEWFDPV